MWNPVEREKGEASLPWNLGAPTGEQSLSSSRSSSYQVSAPDPTLPGFYSTTTFPFGIGPVTLPPDENRMGNSFMVVVVDVVWPTE